MLQVQQVDTIVGLKIYSDRYTRFGHFARECREEEDRCYKCHGTGHIARNCSQDEDTCYNCNEVKQNAF